MLDDSGSAGSLLSEQRYIQEDGLNDGRKFYFKCHAQVLTTYCIDNGLLGCAFEPALEVWPNQTEYADWDDYIDINRESISYLTRYIAWSISRRSSTLTPSLSPRVRFVRA